VENSLILAREGEKIKQMPGKTAQCNRKDSSRGQKAAGWSAEETIRCPFAKKRIPIIEIE
jgi:hypothetical protein